MSTSILASMRCAQDDIANDEEHRIVRDELALKYKEIEKLLHDKHTKEMEELKERYKSEPAASTAVTQVASAAVRAAAGAGAAADDAATLPASASTAFATVQSSNAAAGGSAAAAAAAVAAVHISSSSSIATTSNNNNDAHVSSSVDTSAAASDAAEKVIGTLLDESDVASSRSPSPVEATDLLLMSQSPQSPDTASSGSSGSSTMSGYLTVSGDGSSMLPFDGNIPSSSSSKEPNASPISSEIGSTGPDLFDMIEPRESDLLVEKKDDERQMAAEQQQNGGIQHGVQKQQQQQQQPQSNIADGAADSDKSAANEESGYGDSLVQRRRPVQGRNIYSNAHAELRPNDSGMSNQMNVPPMQSQPTAAAATAPAVPAQFNPAADRRIAFAGPLTSTPVVAPSVDTSHYTGSHLQPERTMQVTDPHARPSHAPPQQQHQQQAIVLGPTSVQHRQPQQTFMFQNNAPPSATLHNFDRNSADDRPAIADESNEDRGGSNVWGSEDDDDDDEPEEQGGKQLLHTAGDTFTLNNSEAMDTSTDDNSLW